MSAKEILSEQMTQMRIELAEINMSAGRIREALEIMNKIYKNPVKNDLNDDVCFTQSQFKSLCELWEHMYRGAR